MTTCPECRDVRPVLPLLAGNDLCPDEQAAAERHVKRCPSCQEHLSDLQAAQAVLAEVRLSPVETAPSLWDDLQPRIARAFVRPVQSRSGWIPVAALATACAALLLVGVFGPSFDPVSGIVSTGASGGQGRDVRNISGAGERVGPGRPESPHYSQTISY